jgi:hypothetical protein
MASVAAFTASTRDRLTEARLRHWLGEVAALEDSLHHIAKKKAQLIR